MISEGNVGPSTEIRISGTFTPAAGPAAKFGDATAARRLAQRTVAALLLTVAATLTNFCTVNA
jgi:hypothetical protein